MFPRWPFGSAIVLSRAFRPEACLVPLLFLEVRSVCFCRTEGRSVCYCPPGGRSVSLLSAWRLLVCASVFLEAARIYLLLHEWGRELIFLIITLSISFASQTVLLLATAYVDALFIWREGTAPASLFQVFLQTWAEPAEGGRWQA